MHAHLLGKFITARRKKNASISRGPSHLRVVGASRPRVAENKTVDRRLTHTLVLSRTQFSPKKTSRWHSSVPSHERKWRLSASLGYFRLATGSRDFTCLKSEKLVEVRIYLIVVTPKNIRVRRMAMIFARNLMRYYHR